MKRLLLLAALLAGALTACQPSQSDKPTPSGGEAITEDAAKIDTAETEVSVKAGAVRLRLKTPVSEQFACIIPIQLENGLETSTRVTMIGFKVLGPGDDASGNMFAPEADAGGKSEARVIIQGQGCAAFDTLSIPEIRCTSGDEDCAAKIELIDGGGLSFARAG